MELTQRMDEPRMLARDGRSVRSARARHHYDDVMGDAMIGTDTAIKWSTAAAGIGVAVVAARQAHRCGRPSDSAQ